MSTKPTIRSSRFVLEQELGSGGFGVVYLAHDRQRDERVALKVLQHLEASALYRFKQEFRSLADLVHPNLVSLHELICEEGQWFFTMELLRGESFLNHVQHCGGQDPVEVATDSDTELDAGQGLTLPLGETTLPPLQGGDGPATGRGGRGGQVDLTRLRAALGQLVEGVAALHAAGKLHRDIKPANVMVTAEGRVVLLDFGLVSEILDEQADSQIVGTPHYMSPEMAHGRALTEGSDWYSVGVMLYEALTGALPFGGGGLQVMLRKQTEDPTTPATLDPALPADLSDLCMALLDRDPARRPSTAALLQDWAPEESPSARFAVARDPGVGALLGRAREQEVLLEAADRVRRGRTVIVHVFGPSGVGKSTLVQHVVEELARRRGAGRPFVSLSGRSYEQESVPYKALDSLVDALCDHLRGLDQEASALLLPRNLPLLCRLFPVLSRVAAVRAALEGSPELELSPQEQRRRGVVALRELLARLGERSPLVLVLDDAQWGDEDSAEVLDRLLRPPDPPRLLLLACHRSEAAQESAFVKRLRAVSTGERESDCVDLPLTELCDDASQELALALLGERGDHATARAVARESRGNPFLITTLAQHVEGAEGAGLAGDGALIDVSLERALKARLAPLPEAARCALDLVCLAGAPISERVIGRAAGDDDRTSFKLLRATHLLRSLEADGPARVAPYHDRIRETVLGFIAPDRRRELHLGLATALEASGAAEPDLLALHLEQAGESARAARYARQAADRAREALAFDRAALLLRRAMSLQKPTSEQEDRALQIALADTLVDGQRGSEAAPIYLEAAASAPREQELELKRRAAEQWMKSGHIEQGRVLLQEVLAAFGMKLPPTPRRALFSLLRRRARLKLRGLRFSLREPGAQDAEALATIDLCWSGWIGLCMHDFVHAAELHTRNLRLSLEAGEPLRIARALAMEAVLLATGGAGSVERTERLLTQARQLGETIGSDHALGLVELAAGVSAYSQGRMHLIHDACVRADELLRNLPGTYYELGMAHLYAIEGLVHTGRMADLQQQLSGYIAEAEGRGDLFAVMGMRVQGHLAHLAADDPDLARREMEQGMASYSDEIIRLPHYWEFYALGQIQLYAGQGQLALEQVDQRWLPLKRAMLLRLQVALIGARYLRGRCALAAAVEEPRRAPELLRVAAREARLLLKEKTTMGSAKGRLVQAGVAAGRGDLAAARQILTQAAEGFESVQMNHYAAAARRRLAQLTEGPEGREALAQIDAQMRQQAVRDPARWTAMLAPGPYEQQTRPTTA